MGVGKGSTLACSGLGRCHGLFWMVEREMSESGPQGGEGPGP